MTVTPTRVCTERHVSTESTGTTAHARQDTPATGVSQVGLNRCVMLAITERSWSTHLKC